MRAEKSATELDTSDEYDRLRRRIEALESKLDDPIDADPQPRALVNDD